MARTKILAALLLSAGLARAQDPVQGTEAKVFTGASGKTLPYRIRVSKAPEGGKLPLLLFLHGAGERGDDNSAQVKHGIQQFIARESKHPCILVVPQCPKNVWWSSVRRDAAGAGDGATDTMVLVIELVDAMAKEHGADPSRLYVTGLSMGGFGTWDLIARKPDLFAAAVPICGGGDVAQAPVIAKIPQWVFHGDKDTAVKVEQSRRMVEAMKAAGGSPKYTEYPGVGHNSWDPAYADDALYEWLFAQKKG